MADSTPNAEREGRTYEPGPSFVANDRPDVRLAELPAWLQTFASGVGEPEPRAEQYTEQRSPEVATAEHEPDEMDEHAVENESEVDAAADELEESGVGLPGWLNEPRAGDPGQPDQGDDSSSFMISEDDLPEWLRTISPATQQHRSNIQQESPMTVEQDENENFGSLGLPSVARVWVTNGSNALSDGGSLFALVASQASSGAMMMGAADAESVGSSSGSSGQSSEFKTDSLGAARSSGQPEKLTTQANLEDDGTADGSSKLRIVLLIALIVLVLLLLAMTQLG